MHTTTLPYPQLTRATRVRKGLWRASLVLLTTLLALASIGAVYQTIAEAADRRAFPPPGRLVDVGGHRLHIQCIGAGGPTVVLDHMGGGNSAQWGLILPQLAATTRVCTYDRAGFGWSDPVPPGPRDAQTNADDLHTLLVNAGEQSPFLLVGHSYGGRVAKLFAASYPAEVAGLVLVDPGTIFGHPTVPPEIDAQWREEDQLFIRNGSLLARLGAFRLLYLLSDVDDTGDLAKADHAAFTARALAAQQWDAIRAEAAGMEQSSAQELALLSLEALPILVLSAEQPAGAARAAHTALNREVASLSSRGEHRIIAGAEHLSFAWEQRYADIVADTVRGLLAQARVDR